jgi:hypothetical protein
MKKIISAVLALISTSSLAVNTEPGHITSIESRDTGFHGIWLTSTIPNQNCTFNDRAVVREEDVGGKTQLSILLTALVSNKKVVVGVSGCTDTGVVGAGTSPRVIKAQIYSD